MPDMAMDSAMVDLGSDAQVDMGTVTDAGRLDAGGDAGNNPGPPTPPTVLITSGAVNLGTYTCGSPAPGAMTATVENVGGSRATVIVEEGYVVGAPEQIPWFDVSIVDHILDPGEATQLIITPVPASGILPGTRTAIAWVRAVETAGASPVSISMDVAGPYLYVSRSGQDFGTIPVGQSANLFGNMSVYNAGTSSLDIDVDADFDDGFVVTWPGSPTTPFALAPSASALVNVAFRPTSPGYVRGTLALSTTDTLCGIEADALAVGFSGTGISGSLALSTLELEFGTDLCGTAGEAQSVTVRNTGDAPLTWGASLAGGTTRFSLSAPGGVLNAGASTTLTVTPATAPATSPTLPVDLSDSLTITSSVATDEPRVIALRRTLGGAQLRWLERGALRPEIVAPLGGSGTTVVHLVNEGTHPVSIASLFHPTQISTAPATNFVVPPGTSLPITLTYTPTTPASAVFDIGVGATSEGVCNTRPINFDSLIVDVRTAGLLDFTPSLVPLNGPCGSRPTGMVLVTNNGTAPETGTIQLDPAGAFEARIGGTLVASTFQAPAGTTTAIEISPVAPFPTVGVPGAWPAGGIEIATESGARHQAILAPRSHGAYIETVSTAIGPWDVPVGSYGTFDVELRNRGDQSFMLQAFLPHGENRIFTVPAATGSGPGVAMVRGSVFVASEGILTPAASATFALLSGQSATGLCSPLPETAYVRPNGVDGELSVETTPMRFGDNFCGAGPPSPRLVQLRNTGAAPFSYTATLARGDYFRLEPGDESGNIPAGGTSYVTVIPEVLGAGAVPGPTSDTLVIRSSLAGDTPRSIALDQTVRGVVLTLPTSVPLPTVREGGSGFGPLFFAMSGNVPVDLDFDEGGSDLLNEIAVGPHPYLRAYDRPGPLAVYFNPRDGGTRTLSLVPTVPAGAPVCSGTLNPILVTGRVGTPPLQVYPNLIEWSTVLCGGSPESRTFAIRNTSTAPQSFTLSAALGGDTRFYVSPMSGTIPAGGSEDISIITNVTWPLAEVVPEGRSLVVGDTWHERYVVAVGDERVAVDLVVSTSGAGFLMDPQFLPWSDGTTRIESGFLTTTTAGVADYVLQSTPSGSCAADGSAVVCGPGAGSLTYATSSPLGSGRCVPTGIHQTLPFP